jgi:hypothetical protein
MGWRLPQAKAFPIFVRLPGFDPLKQITGAP